MSEPSVGPPLLTWYELPWRPVTAFGSPCTGTPMFSRVVALLARELGQSEIEKRLAGYRAGRPFVVVGDPRPRGFVPRPALSAHELDPPSADAKAIKRVRWIPERVLELPMESWIHQGITDEPLLADAPGSSRTSRSTSIRTLVATTQGGAATRAPAHLYHPGVDWVIDLLVDASRGNVQELHAALRVIGLRGLGAHAARGMGKFELGQPATKPWPTVRSSMVFSLGACSPPKFELARPQQNLARYRTKIVRGWHGPEHGDGVRLAKAPIVMADAGARFCVPPDTSNFFGRGFDATDKLTTLSGPVVAQGYAPVLHVRSLAVAT